MFNVESVSLYPYSGEGDSRYIYLPPPNFCYKIRNTIDFCQNFLTLNFCGQLRHDIRSLKYVSRCFVEGRQPLRNENYFTKNCLKKKPRNNMYFCLETP